MSEVRKAQVLLQKRKEEAALDGRTPRSKFGARSFTVRWGKTFAPAHPSSHDLQLAPTHASNCKPPTLNSCPASMHVCMLVCVCVCATALIELISVAHLSLRRFAAKFYHTQPRAPKLYCRLPLGRKKNHNNRNNYAQRRESIEQIREKSDAKFEKANKVLQLVDCSI